jgi:hypothetical protein
VLDSLNGELDPTMTAMTGESRGDPFIVSNIHTDVSGRLGVRD